MGTLVLEDAEKQLPRLIRLLDEFGNLSGMRVKVAKTVAVPVWEEETLEEIRRRLQTAAPLCQELQVADHAVYLGCSLGPNKAAFQWSKALENLVGKCWAGIGRAWASNLPRSLTICMLYPLSHSWRRSQTQTSVS